MIEIDKPKQRQESPAPFLRNAPSTNDLEYYYREPLEAFMSQNQNQKQKEQQEKKEQEQ
jgi:hypothetical protein